MEPIRTAVIGLGRAGWGMIIGSLRRRTDQYRIVAGADLIAERRQRLEEELGGRSYRDYRDLLADSDVELVVVATRSNTHVPIAIDALRAGKHVVLEKPLALTLRGMDRLLRVARRARGKLIPRHNRRFDPDFLAVREVVESGILGEIRHITLCRHGFNRRNDWQTLRRFGGGMLANWGPHIIDHGLRLLGAPVRSMFSDLQKIAAAGDAEDHVKIVMCGTNGRVVDIEISGGAAIGDVPYRIFGTCGALTCDGKKMRVRWFDPGQVPPVKASAATPTEQGFGNAEQLPWQEEERDAVPQTPADFWDSVHDAVRRDVPFPVSLSEAREVVKITEQARAGTKFEIRFEE